MILINHPLQCHCLPLHCLSCQHLNPSLLFHSSTSLLVSRANLTVAATISRESLHLGKSPSFVFPDQPPSAKDRSPHLLDLLASLQMLRRWTSHNRHLNKKWSTDSNSRPQLQVSTSIALILAKCLLSLHCIVPRCVFREALCQSCE